MIDQYLCQIQLPAPDSHKGQNGKLLIIGGSDLFHAASKWSLDVASKFVDMVFYSSVPSNNELVQQAKGEFWNGIVVERENLEEYLFEADCVLIGPGMTRSDETETLTNELLRKFPDKKWVVDAGAVQMVDPTLLGPSCILTPHYQELDRLVTKLPANFEFGNPTPDITTVSVREMSGALNGATLVIKGVMDFVGNTGKIEVVAGGNPGMTKGGTGDVLAGLVAALYCRHDAFISAVVGSYVNKKAGDSLYQRVGPYFNASDLVEEIPAVLWWELQRVTAS